MAEEKINLKCPECGGEMSFDGYRPLFPTCTECEKSFHVNDCIRRQD